MHRLRKLCGFFQFQNLWISNFSQLFVFVIYSSAFSACQKCFQSLFFSVSLPTFQRLKEDIREVDNEIEQIEDSEDR